MGGGADPAAGVEGGSELVVTVGEAYAVEFEGAGLRAQAVRQAQAQRQRAILSERSLAGLVAGRFVLAAQHKELIGPLASPFSLPLGVTGIAVGRKVELGAQQPLAAEAQAGHASGVVGFKGGAAGLECG